MDYGLSHAISESDLVEGDHIYAWREALVYSHQGIYAGQCAEGVHWVIHFLGGIKNDEGYTGCPLTRSCRSREHSRPRGVSKTCLSCFLQGCTLRKYKYNASSLEYHLLKRGGTCTFRKPDDSAKVVARANRLLENDGFGHYNLFARNCESFALYCSTGDLESATSNQVRHGIMAAATAATVLAFGIGYVLKSIYTYSTKVTEEEKEDEEQEGRTNGTIALAM